MREPIIYGRCPGALTPMESGDGLLVRVRPRLGRLSQDQMRALADIADMFGNGELDLSARANLQIRGIKEKDHENVLSHLSAAKLLDENAEAEARNNVLLQPFWLEGDDTFTIAKDLGEKLRQEKNLLLPSKFGFAVDCGDKRVLARSSADIRIERSKNGGCLIRCDGDENGFDVAAKDAAKAAVEVAGWFVAAGGVKNGRGRMKDLVRRTSYRFCENLVSVPAKNAPETRVGNCREGYLLGFEFGAISSGVLRQMSEVGSVRTTPWLSLLLENASSPPANLEAILTPDDPRLRASACVGAPRCLQSKGVTREIASALSEFLGADKTLRVSGCEKHCASSNNHDVTLTAVDANTYRYEIMVSPSEKQIGEVSKFDLLEGSHAILQRT